RSPRAINDRLLKLQRPNESVVAPSNGWEHLPNQGDNQ
ncbi:MAG: hypothetical protein RL685_7506, partial [Pseudomonadota bacterium]